MSYRLDGKLHGPRFYQTGRFAALLAVAGTAGAIVAIVLGVNAADDTNTSYLYLGEAPRFSDGVWRVADQARAGTYDNEGANEDCYWARLSAVSLSEDAVIESGGGTGRTLVFVGLDDVAFLTRNCGTWERIQ